MRFNSPAEIQGNASDAAEAFDAIVPDWREREAYGDRYLSERDVQVPGTDATRAVLAISDADFDAMCEALWTDPADRDY